MMSISSAAIKKLAGNDPISSRRLDANPGISFNPTHRLFLATSHQPQVHDSDFLAFSELISQMSFKIDFKAEDQPTP